jgi:hypothetical protein
MSGDHTSIHIHANINRYVYTHIHTHKKKIQTWNTTYIWMHVLTQTYKHANLSTVALVALSSFNFSISLRKSARGCSDTGTCKFGTFALGSALLSVLSVLPPEPTGDTPGKSAREGAKAKLLLCLLSILCDVVEASCGGSSGGGGAALDDEYEGIFDAWEREERREDDVANVSSLAVALARSSFVYVREMRRVVSSLEDRGRCTASSLVACDADVCCMPACVCVYVYVCICVCIFSQSRRLSSDLRNVCAWWASVYVWMFVYICVCVCVCDCVDFVVYFWDM